MTYTDGEECNCLVNPAEGGNIDGLTTDGTSGTDTGAVFARTAVDNGVNGDLERVLVGHDVDLYLVLASFPVQMGPLRMRASWVGVF